MAYIPPHMRRSKDPQRPSPVPEMLEPAFNRQLNLESSKRDADMGLNLIQYAYPAVHRSFVCGLDNDHSISSDYLEEFPEEPDEHKRSVTTNLARDNDKACANISRSPWESIAENIWPDVVSACNIVKNKMEEKLILVARFGNLLFKEKDIRRLESVREHQVAETALKSMRKCFYTGVPATYMEKIVNEVVPKIGVDFVEYKDIYFVKLCDGTRQITCKCTVKEDKKLELYKVELNQVRHMVADIFCFDENLDLRLALYTKSAFSALSDDEMKSIRILINSAILDPEAKGGLRWPMGKSYSRDYTVVGVWHNEFKSYKSPSLKLKVRNVDRFIFKTGTGVSTIEINLKFRRIVSEIQGGEIDIDSIYNGFKDNLRLIWDHFLSWEDDTDSVQYADHAVRKWFVCGLDNDNSFPSSIHFEEFTEEPVENKRGGEPLVLVVDNDEVNRNISRSPWELVAENIWPDILSACKIVKKEMEEKPTLTARFGNLLFNKYHLLSLESAREGKVAETALSPVRRFFYRGAPATYMEKIVNEVVPKIGVDFVEYKDIYCVKLSDSTREIMCKCTLKEDKKLDLYKVELNPVCHMIADMSCPYKHQDLRLALCAKSTLSALSDDEKKSIRILINSAILDPEVNGGLRWPMRRPYSGDYTVIGVWHTEIESYKSPSLKLKVENVAPFFIEFAGWKTVEIYLKWRSIVSEIQDGEIDTDSIYIRFKEQLRLIWDHFLSTDCKLSRLAPTLRASYMRLCASSTGTSRNM